MFLPDKQSPWCKGYPNFDKKFKIEEFQNDIDNIIRISEPAAMQHAESQSSSDHISCNEPWNLLGLRGFKVPNDMHTVFNILLSPVINKKTITADFQNNASALRPYMYARNVTSNASRSETSKDEVKQWLKTMPPEPVQPKQPRQSRQDNEQETATGKEKELRRFIGFAKGAAAQHFGENHVHVLERVVAKSLAVKKNTTFSLCYS